MLNTANITREDIKQADTKDLLELYNTMTGKSVKKFSSRTAGESQVWKLVGQLAPGEDIRETIMKEKSPEKSSEKKATKKNGKRDDYEHRVIKVLIKENPKRPGSRAHKKFDLLMKMDGKTIKDFKNEEGRFPTLDMEPGWPATELRWAMKLELVKLVNA